MSEILREALNKAYNRRKRYIEKSNLAAFRLISASENQFGISVDVYLSFAVVNLFKSVKVDTLKLILAEIRGYKKFSFIFLKNRTGSKEADSFIAEHNAMAETSNVSTEILVEENNLKFSLNLSEYLDIGLFLDHRETRKYLLRKSSGKDVLNTFAYTGSFSVYAAAGGANSVFSVDLSKTYCNWTERNLLLNGFDKIKHPVYSMEIFEFFKFALKKQFCYDFIVIDPPTFSKSKKSNFSVQRDHSKLIESAAGLLKNNGSIIFSNNYKDFKLDSKIQKKFKVRDITSSMKAVDFTDEQLVILEIGRK